MTRQQSLVIALGLVLLAGIVPAGTPPLRAQNAVDGAIANAALVHSRISVGTTEDETQIKATPGAIYSITATNINAAARYLKCYNLTAAVAAPGTSTPFVRFAIPPSASGPLNVTFPQGALFSVALTCALVTGVADSDVAEVAANEVIWTITYK
jgi:hypothetical protein